MKALIFLLLVANVVVAGFSVISYRQEGIKKKLPSGLNPTLYEESIILLSEYRSQQGEESLRDSLLNEAFCTRIVGDWDSNQLQEIISLLEGEHAEYLKQGTIKHARVSYWVTIPPLKDHSQAVAVKLALHSSQVADLFILKSGERRHALSLGIYASEEAAVRRAQHINSLAIGGKAAEVEVITLYVDRPWVEYHLERPIVELLPPELLNGSLEQSQQRCSTR